MSLLTCPQCGANLESGRCEYCGWNSSTDKVPCKTFRLSGVLCELTVTKEDCAFVQKVGGSMTIHNDDIIGISVVQAPLTGTGELRFSTQTGISQKIAFLYTQNSVMNEIVSYLSMIRPNIKFTNDALNNDEQPETRICPKCHSTNLVLIKNKTFSIALLVIGGLFILSTFSGGTVAFQTRVFIFALGLFMVLYGTRKIGKRKKQYLCSDCKKKFTA